MGSKPYVPYQEGPLRRSGYAGSAAAGEREGPGRLGQVRVRGTWRPWWSGPAEERERELTAQACADAQGREGGKQNQEPELGTLAERLHFCKCAGAFGLTGMGASRAPPINFH
jgi:hypothetical protein